VLHKASRKSDASLPGSAVLLMRGKGERGPSNEKVIFSAPTARCHRNACFMFLLNHKDVFLLLFFSLYHGVVPVATPLVPARISNAFGLVESDAVNAACLG
jgi:hypothetical protein